MFIRPASKNMGFDGFIGLRSVLVPFARQPGFFHAVYFGLGQSCS
jgi:hypothetical protein